VVSKPFQAISAHWATPYIGLPWSKHGQGPETWNCWSFFRHVQAAHFGVETPVVPYADDLLVLARLFRDHQERGHWQPAAAYREGDGVMMRTARYPIHVGVWLGVAPDQAIDLTKADTMAGLVEAIIRHENGQQPYAREVILAGVGMGLGSA
jgi:hypothetical protein